MVDYFDTGSFGSNSPFGITFIPTSGNFAIVDNGVDEVFIVDSKGILQSQFDTTAFGSNNPQGITYISNIIRQKTNGLQVKYSTKNSTKMIVG